MVFCHLLLINDGLIGFRGIRPGVYLVIVIVRLKGNAVGEI